MHTHVFVFPQADFQHKFTVQASPTMDKRKSLINSRSSPPASPTIIPRLRAIQCETLSQISWGQDTPGAPAYSFQLPNSPGLHHPQLLPPLLHSVYTHVHVCANLCPPPSVSFRQLYCCLLYLFLAVRYQPRGLRELRG